MNRSARSLKRASVLAPVAVVVAVASAPTNAVLATTASATTASATTGAVPVRDAADRAAVADLTRQAVPLPATSVDGVLSAARGAAKVHTARDGAQNAVAQLGSGVLRTAGGDLAFTSIAARCTSAADGTVRGVTTIIRRGRAGAGLSWIPVNPPVGLQLPAGRSGKVITLNKQVRDRSGRLIVTSVQVDGAPGRPARALGVVRCDPVRRLAGAVTRRADEIARTVQGVPAGKAAGAVKGMRPDKVTAAGTLDALTGLVRRVDRGGGKARGLTGTSKKAVSSQISGLGASGLQAPAVDPATVVPGALGRVNDAAGTVRNTAQDPVSAPAIAQSALGARLGGLPGLGILNNLPVPGLLAAVFGLLGGLR